MVFVDSVVTNAMAKIEVKSAPEQPKEAAQAAPESEKVAESKPAKGKKDK